MIWYDSHRISTLVKIRGSVLPQAMIRAFPSAGLAFALRYFAILGYYQQDALSVLAQGDVYSGFTFVLGFSLVFRTSQSYLRYWTAATSVHEMSCEWGDSCASLIAFATISRAELKAILEFRHTVVRLFSLMHAMALTEIADYEQAIPLLDVNGLSKEHLMVLTQGHAQGKKVQIVMSWIKGYIIEAGDAGLLNVPAPILTRVFQELGDGLVNYHKALHIVLWPFPFPYTQLNWLLIQVYSLITPVVISTWPTYAWVCCVFTFISVTCMVALDLIACELENPFGDDANDLPVLDMQKDMNKFLTMQLHPAMQSSPRLLPTAIMDYQGMVLQCAEFGRPTSRSLADHCHRSGSTLGAALSVSAAATRRRNSSLWASVTCKHHVGAESGAPSELLQMREWLCCSNEGSGLFSPPLQESFEAGSGERPDLESGGQLEHLVEASASAEATDPVPPPAEVLPEKVLPEKVAPAEPPFISEEATVTSTKRRSRASGRVSTMMDVEHEEWEGSRPSVVSDWREFLEKLRSLLDGQLALQQEERRTFEGILYSTGVAFAGRSRLLGPAEPRLGERGSDLPISKEDFFRSFSADSESDEVALPPKLPPPLLMRLEAVDEGR